MAQIIRKLSTGDKIKKDQNPSEKIEKNNLVVDWDNTLKIDKREYYEVDSTEITSVEALKKEFDKSCTIN